MNTQSTLVVGGTGKTGRRVTSGLQARGRSVRVACRSGPQRFDWYDPATWGPALDGAGSAYITPLLSPDAAAQVAAFCDAARAHGVTRLVLLSGGKPDVPAEALPGYSRTERASEQALRDSGLGWTIVRPSWFSQNFSEDFLLDGILAGELRAPAGDGAVPFTDAEDVAAVAVAALTQDGHAGKTYDLTGPRSLTFGAAVAEIAQATGRDIRYVAISPEEFATELRGHEVPPTLVEGLVELFSMARTGRYDHVSEGVQQVLGRPPRDFSDYVKQAAATGVWNA